MASKVAFMYYYYYCTKCGAGAQKEPLTNKSNRPIRVKGKNKQPAKYVGLGTWHCTGGCRGKVKVERRRKEKFQEKVAA